MCHSLIRALINSSHTDLCGAFPSIIMASIDRANRLLAQMQLQPLPTAAAASPAAAPTAEQQQGKGKASLTVTDNRTGKQVEMPIQNGTIVATKFLDFGLK
jgi:hypothetical protein